jgi:hypothetical protein
MSSSTPRKLIPKTGPSLGKAGEAQSEDPLLDFSEAALQTSSIIDTQGSESSAVADKKSKSFLIAVYSLLLMITSCGNSIYGKRMMYVPHLQVILSPTRRN